MPLIYTAEELIESIRNLGMVPDTGQLGSDEDDILRHLNEEMALSIIPQLIATREDFLIVTERQTLSPNVLKYRVPARAIGNKLRWVRYVSSDGNRHPIDQIGIGHLEEYDWSSLDSPQGYYIEGNYLCLVGSSFSGSIEWSYHYRPGEMVLSTDCRQITAVDTATKTITTSANLPTTWATTNLFDIHGNESGAEIKTWSAVATVVGGMGLEDKITFSGAIDGSTVGTHPVQIGDWVCLEKTAAVPAIPRDLQPLLIRALGYRMAEASGDTEKVKVAHDLYKEAAAAVLPLLTIRAGVSPRLRGCKGIIWKQK